MSKNLKIFAFYSTSAFIYTFGLFYNFVHCMFPQHNGSVFEAARDKLQYLTTWDSVLQSVYFTLSTISLMENLIYNNKDTVLNKICDSIHVGLVFPFGSLVTCLFWAIWAVDRELVFPRTYSIFIPDWINHVMHTLPLITAIIDCYLINHSYSTSNKGISLTLLFTSSYLSFTLYNALVNGIWIYPLLKILNHIQRTIFFIMSGIALAGFYKMGEIMNSMFWLSNNKIKQKTTKKLK